MRQRSINSSLHGQLTNEVQNGVTIARTYDAFNRPTGYILMQNGGASPPGEPFAVSYAYDPIGNRLSATEYAESGDALVSAYSANALNQYTQRTVPGTAQVRGFADADAEVTVNGNGTWRNGEYFYGGDDADISALPVFKEVAIEALRPAATPDDYDEIAAVTGRVFVAQSPETFEYDADDGMHNAQCIMHNDCAVSLARHQPSLSATMGGEQLCIVHYALCIGEIVAHYDYSPFGETLIETGNLASTFTHRFSTKPWCPVTGLYEYQMRKYRPEIGRWLSRDPIGEDGGEGLYGYAFNSPMDSIDFIGLSIFDWKIWPWNWFEKSDGCKSEFNFDDMGWEYQRTMDGLRFEYEKTLIVANMIYEETAIVQTNPDFGYTISDYNMAGYSCCCDKTGKYTSQFYFSVFSKTYILDKTEIEWGDDNRRFNDPRVGEYWRHSTKWWRRHMTRVHEERHRKHAKSNFDRIVKSLRRATRQYDTEEECLSNAERILKDAKDNFRKLEKEAADKVERGEL